MGCCLNKKTIIDVSNQLRLNNKTVVLTHGAFDLFHIGHNELLKESKRKGDYLIVGLESDERTGKYKKGRPIIPLAQRIEIMVGNKHVDFVFAIKGVVTMEKYYIDLCRKVNPKIVTYGKVFGFQKEMKERKKILTNVTFSQISHQYNHVQSTTNIIDTIRKKS